MSAIWYLGFSTFIGLGFHPMAGHFIAEHYTVTTSRGGPPHHISCVSFRVPTIQPTSTSKMPPGPMLLVGRFMMLLGELIFGCCVWGILQGIWSGDNITSGFSGHKKGENEKFADETYTYRGPLNMFSYNVGIHVAHHDFPNISGLRLKEVEKMAPEFYDHLPVVLTTLPRTHTLQLPLLLPILRFTSR